MLAIIDYGAGNLQSVKKALDYLGAACEITDDPHKIETARGVILPGVGSFGEAMESMHRRGLFSAVRRAADGTRPFLGICLGQQLLFAASEESPGAPGFGALPGSVVKLPSDGGKRKIPHMGWNSIALQTQEGLFAGVPQGTYVYFVHSFYVRAQNPAHIAATTEYGAEIHAAVHSGQLWATQFHPEKSGEAGLLMLRNFIGLC
ncbi:MAG: imidazole glycerol phosphate synthase subunit HisH [Oscillospiraceae bacterium]|jgi:glutamine amidotransferase|nr:imidazole glycerol phosphate synthase subunit HisH [Oscillospiraceae bacterium]